MPYNKKIYAKLISLKVPHGMALALADESNQGQTPEALNPETATPADLANAFNNLCAVLAEAGVLR